MSKLIVLLSLPVAALVGAAFVGCSKQEAPAPAPPAVVEEETVEEVEVPAVQTEAPAAETPAAEAPAAEASAADSAAVTDAMAGLSEADRAAALAQKVCPVSGEPLGEMGPPVKVTVKGRDVYLCCENCRKELEAKPDEYLAKLDAAK